MSSNSSSQTSQQDTESYIKLYQAVLGFQNHKSQQKEQQKRQQASQQQSEKSSNEILQKSQQQISLQNGSKLDCDQQNIDEIDKRAQVACEQNTALCQQITRQLQSLYISLKTKIAQKSGIINAHKMLAQQKFENLTSKIQTCKINIDQNIRLKRKLQKTRQKIIKNYNSNKNTKIDGGCLNQRNQIKQIKKKMNQFFTNKILPCICQETIALPTNQQEVNQMNNEIQMSYKIVKQVVSSYSNSHNKQIQNLSISALDQIKRIKGSFLILKNKRQNKIKQLYEKINIIEKTLQKQIRLQKVRKSKSAEVMVNNAQKLIVSLTFGRFNQQSISQLGECKLSKESNEQVLFSQLENLSSRASGSQISETSLTQLIANSLPFINQKQHQNKHYFFGY